MKSSVHIMSHFLESRISEIQELCRRFHVKRLWAFGSILREDFRSDSDVDLLYEWDRSSIEDDKYLDNLWGLLDALEALLGHKVDFVHYPSLKNPYFIEEVDETKVLLYDQEREEVFV